MSYTPTEWESTDVVTATRMNALEQAVGDMNMSYTPNTWSDGDILSAEKMNALEQAVASGGGGSSDFSTASVHIICTNPTAHISFSALGWDEDLEVNYASALASMGTLWATEFYLEGTRDETIDFVMMSASFALDSYDTITCTGDATVQILGDGLYLATITGDCTITIS